MKRGVRAVGIAESYTGEESTLCAAVTTTDGVVDGFAFGRCTVGGMDATTAIRELYARLDREDIRYIFVSGVALAWYNIVQLRTLAADLDRPVLALSYEASDGLADAIREAFDESEGAIRLARFRVLPARRPVELDGGDIYVRAVGLEDESPESIVRAYTRAGLRPEPVRVARLAARAADEYRTATESESL